MENLTVQPPERRRRPWIAVTAWASAAVLVSAAAVSGAVLLQDAPATQAEATVVAPSSSPTPTLTPTPSPTVPPAPPKPTPVELSALPLAFYDAVIPQLLDSGMITPLNQWKIATPRDELVALYATPTPDATPIAALGRTVMTVNTPTAVAVYGVSGDMILVSTPSRRVNPGKKPAPSSTFAWARTADFTLAPAAHTVTVDNATSTIRIVSRSGTVSATEVARLGTKQDPTPADTATYIESIYTDSRAAYTQGHPISLTGAHSSTILDYGGNSGLTAIHFYPSVTGLSHGCVRVSAKMTHALAALPIGTPVLFS